MRGAPCHGRLMLCAGEVEAAVPPLLGALASSRSGHWEPSTLCAALPQLTSFDHAAGRWEGQGLYVRVPDLKELPRIWSGPNAATPAEGKAGWIELSRGCRYSCSFCIVCSMKAGEFSAFGSEVIASEVVDAYGRGVRSFGLLAAATNYDKGSLGAACSAIKGLGGDVGVSGTIHVNYLDQERLALIRDLRWETMIVGLQTITPEAQRLMKRAEQPDSFGQGIEQLATFATPEVELILGLPGDTLEGFKRSINFALGLPISVSVYRLRLDPWSRYLEKMEPMGIEADFHNLGRVLSVPGFSATEIDEAEAWLLGLGSGQWKYRASRIMYDGREIWPKRERRK